jgi:hypothetical protein
MNAPQQHDRGDMAEMLAAAIGQHFGVDFGAPGQDNDPAENAMVWITKVATTGTQANLTRYDCVTNGGADDPMGTMEPCADGEYVRFDDVAPLLAAPAASVPADRDAEIDALWERSNHGTMREDIAAAYEAGETSALKGKPAAPAAKSGDLHAAIMNLPCNSLHAGSPREDVQRAYAEGFKRARHDAAELASEHSVPAAPLTVPQGDWISVDEREPEEDQRVLALIYPYNNAENSRLITEAVYHDGLFLDHECEKEIHPPTHWMPRPSDPAAPAVPGSGMAKGEGQ